MHPGQQRAAAVVGWLAVAASMSLSGSATAAATPSLGVSVVTLSQTTVDGTDYITREITIAPSVGLPEAGTGTRGHAL